MLSECRCFVFVQDRSLLQFQRRFQRKFQANNLSSTFGVSRIPCDSQLRDLIDRHGYAPILPCFADFIGRLQRFKWLQHYQVFDARYLVTLDGSRYFSSELVSCEHCLSTTTDGIERHHHDILQAAIVHPDKRVVLPLAPEFILTVTAEAASTISRIAKSMPATGCFSGSAPTIPGWRQLSSPTAFTPSNRLSKS